MTPQCVWEEGQALESTLLHMKLETEANKQDDQPVPDYTSTASTRTSKIQFDLDATSVLEISGRQEMTPDDFKILFYRATEYANISSWNRMTLKIFRQRAQEGSMTERSSVDDGHCIRGLEHRLKAQRHIRQQIITNAIYSVLDEQSRQRSHQPREAYISSVALVIDADKVAEAYITQTYKSQRNACEMGLQDERTVKELDKPLQELQEVKEEAKEQSQGRPVRRRTLIANFDDNDLGYMKDDASAAAASLARMTKGGQKDELNESFHTKAYRTKAKREGRIKRFFRRASLTNKTSPQETNIEKPATPQPATSQPPTRPRRHRRSSM